MTDPANTPAAQPEPDFEEMAAAVNLAVSWLLISRKPAKKAGDARLLRAAWRARQETRDAPVGSLLDLKALTRHYETDV